MRLLKQIHACRAIPGDLINGKEIIKVDYRRQNVVIRTETEETKYRDLEKITVTRCFEGE